jgi:hypothetical protein
LLIFPLNFYLALSPLSLFFFLYVITAQINVLKVKISYLDMSHMSK